jgi:hypothetical protein
LNAQAVAGRAATALGLGKKEILRRFAPLDDGQRQVGVKLRG